MWCLVKNKDFTIFTSMFRVRPMESPCWQGNKTSGFTRKGNLTKRAIYLFQDNAILWNSITIPTGTAAIFSDILKCTTVWVFKEIFYSTFAASKVIVMKKILDPSIAHRIHYSLITLTANAIQVHTVPLNIPRISRTRQRSRLRFDIQFCYQPHTASFSGHARYTLPEWNYRMMIMTTKFTPVSPVNAQNFISTGYLELVIWGKAVGTWRWFVVFPNAKENRGGAFILRLCTFFLSRTKAIVEFSTKFLFSI